MVEKEKNSNLGGMIGLLFVGLMIGLFAGIIISNATAEEIVIEVEKEQPMLLVMFDSWGENINDSSEVIFIYDILNFGNVEAKNVKIMCEITDMDDSILKQESFNIGNIASNSYEYQESYMVYSGSPSDYLGECFVESADGDYINLRNRLDDL